MNVLWSPQLKQIEFMERPEYEVLYGGAAGGGKSDALLMEALRQVHIPNYRGIIFRDTTKQLEGLISRSMDVYPRAFKEIRFNQTKMTWTFSSGAKIFFGYMQRDNDKYNYQGKAYDFIGFDELTHFTWEQYSYLMSRNRPVGPGTRVYMRATANPGGKGMQWVKDRFITPAPPRTRIWETNEIRTPEGDKVKTRRSRIYIPATVFDNKKLLENDPHYLDNLAALPEAEREALLYGNWESFEGQVFTEWRNDPDHYEDRKWTHVIKPFYIPEDWKIYRGFDFGYAKPFSVAWYAVDYKGKLYRIKEYYGCTGEPNVGLKIHPQEIARNIREIENNDEMLKGKKIIGIADPSIWDESRGESIARAMSQHPFYVYWQPGDNTRLAGKMQFHYRLAFDEYGDPMFQVFDTCKDFIRTIPNLVYSKTKAEDIDTDMEDHIYDESRYVIMANPISPRKNITKTVPLDDPLNLFKKDKPKSLYINI